MVIDRVPCPCRAMLPQIRSLILGCRSSACSFRRSQLAVSVMLLEMFVRMMVMGLWKHGAQTVSESIPDPWAVNAQAPE